MSVNPAGSTIAVRQADTGRIEFRMRIPHVGGDGGRPLPTSAATSSPERPAATLVTAGDEGLAPPRGMQVLRRILDRRSRGGWRRIVKSAQRHRLGFAIGFTGLACLLVAVKFYPSAPDQSPIDGAVVDESVQIQPEDPFAADSASAFGRGQAAAVAGDGAADQGVQTVSYQSVQPPAPRGARLDGTILPDDGAEAPRVEWTFPSGRIVP